MIRSFVAAVMLSVLAACGGGGSSSGLPNVPDTGGGGAGGGGSTLPTEPTLEEYRDAALILDVATFGPRQSDIDAVAKEGVEDWLDRQFEIPITGHEPIVRRYGAQFGFDSQVSPIRPALYRRFAFFENA
jgi:hypothetical protein